MKNPFIRLFRARDKPGATDSVSSAPTFYFGSSAAGKSVTASTAIQMSTVYACVRVIAETIASAVDAGNQHYRAADVMNTEQVINFTIRYRKDVKPGMWVKFQDEKWIISTLGEYSFKKTYLGLKASIAKGVSG